MDHQQITTLYAAAMTEHYNHPVSPDARNVIAFADAIMERNAFALTWIYNGLNEVAKQCFERATGTTLPKTQKGCWAALKAWAGVTAEDEAQERAKQTLAAAEQQVKRERNALSRQISNLPQLEQQLAELLSDGFTEIQVVNRKRYLYRRADGMAMKLSSGNLVPASDFIVAVVAHHNAKAATNAHEVKQVPAKPAAGATASPTPTSIEERQLALF